MGGACDTKEERTDAAGVFAEGDFSAGCLCQLFFFPECSASSLAVPFCLQNQKRPGRPGGRSEAPIPWLDLGLLSMSPGDFRKAQPCPSLLCGCVRRQPQALKSESIWVAGGTANWKQHPWSCVHSIQEVSPARCGENLNASHTSDHPGLLGV